MTKLGILLLDRVDGRNIAAAASNATPPPVVGFTRGMYNSRKELARRFKPDKTRLYFRPTRYLDPDVENAPYSWYFTIRRHLQGYTWAQVDRWVELCTKDGVSLETIVGDMVNLGHDPIVMVNNEPGPDVFQNPDVLQEYDDFNAAVNEYLESIGATGELLCYSVGTTSSDVAKHTPKCNALFDQRRAFLGIREYGYTPDPLLWAGTGGNPYSDLDDRANVFPAWLVGRTTGIPDSVGGFGIPEWKNAQRMTSETGLDVIVDPQGRLLLKPGYTDHNDFDSYYRGWRESMSIVASWAGIEPEQVAAYCAGRIEDYYSRFKLDDDDDAYAYALWFAGGDGYGWENFNAWRTPESLQAILDYWNLPEKAPGVTYPAYSRRLLSAERGYLRFAKIMQSLYKENRHVAGYWRLVEENIKRGVS